MGAGDRAEPLVGVIVLNWNHWPETTRCVEAVRASTYPNVRLLVVDNASDEAPPPELAARDDVEIVQTGSNLGYAGGNNVGIQAVLSAGASYVWVLNNDASPEPDALAGLVSAAEGDGSWGALTSRIVTGEGEEDLGLVLPLSTQRWDPLAPGTHVPICQGADPLHVVEVAYPRGPSLFFRRAALDEVGSFDERYFHYYEEMDLMERLKRAGWRVGMACGSVVVHEKGASLSYDTPQSIYYLHRNHLLFERKLYGHGTARVLLRHPLRRLRVLLSPRHMLHGDFRPFVAHLRAIVDAARGRTGALPLGPKYLEPLRSDDFASGRSG